MSYYLSVQECTEVEIERFEKTTIVWLWNGNDLAHISISGAPDVYATGFDKEPVLLENMRKPKVHKPRVGKDTRARIIDLLTIARPGTMTVKTLITCLPKVHSPNTIWTAFNDIRNSGVEIKTGPSPYGGRGERSFWIEAS